MGRNMNPQDQPRVCQRCGSSDVWIQQVSHALVLTVSCDACALTTNIEFTDHQVLSELTNAVQAALLVAAALERKAVEHAEDIANLESELRRAVTALRKLHIH